MPESHPGVAALAALPAGKRRNWLAGLSAEAALALIHDWDFWARPSQVPPAGDWFCWLVLAGRGFGKTRIGAEWVRALVAGKSPLTAPPGAPGRIALVGDSAADVRDVMIEGESGLMSVTPRAQRPVFEPSRRRLSWPNGAVAFIYAATDPEQLRGPQHHAAWADEIAKWHRGEEAWSNLVLGLRLGKAPKVVATSTPRPLAWIERLAAEPTTAVTGGSTFENRANLPSRFLEEISRLYAGTRLGGQELEGLLLKDREGALWTRAMIEDCRVRQDALPPFERVLVAVDPPASHGEKADACGIIAAGRVADGTVYILEDASMQGLRPAEWARQAIAVYRRHNADRLIGEVNNGGDMVEAVLRQIDPGLSYRAVRASRGKIARAEPVAALYEQGRVRHAGIFTALEDEMCSYTGSKQGDSPDRLDALVWCVHDLALARPGTPSLVRL
ncbi:MAG: terminase family protein [Rhodothalassiaceae bacterium]